MLFVKKMCGLISPDKISLRKYPGGDVAGLQAELERLASLASPDNKVVKNMLQKNKVQYDFQKIAKLSSPKQKKFSCNLCTTPNVIF